MAILKDVREQGQDPQSAKDEKRHNEKLRKTLKEKIGEIISEQEILTDDGKKMVKVKIPSVKERRFVFKNADEERLADGDGDGEGKNGKPKPSPGDGEGEGGKPKPSPGAGNTPGVDLLEEMEFKLEDLIDLMLEDLELKNFLETIAAKPKNKYQPFGKRKIGPYVRISKKETVKRQIARTRAEEKKKKDSDCGGLRPRDYQKEKKKYIDADKRFRYIRPIPDEDVKAVLFCVSDTSGSMDNERIYLARAFYFILARSLKKKGYENLETIFICHDAAAKEVSEADFFKRAGSGGTNLSSGQEKVLEIMEKRFSGEKIDFYVFHATDGENYGDDNAKLAEALKKVCRKSNLAGMAKIKPRGGSFDTHGNEFKKLAAEFPHFMIFSIHKKTDVGPVLRKFLGADRGGKK